MAQETETPSETLESATEAGRLPLRNLTLLGTFTGSDTPQALVRHGDGRVQKVAPGDRIGARRVVAIDQKSLILIRKGATLRLTLPDD